MKNKLKNLVKKYGYFALAGILTVAIAFTIALTIRNSPTESRAVPTQSNDISFTLPMNDFTVLKGFSDNSLQYNATMEQWQAHKAIDLTSDNPLVFAVLDGTVSKVCTDYENGTCITITHSGGFESMYCSLDESVKVTEGDKVVKGQEIGSISNSASEEQNDGKHLHFELFKDGEKVEPSNYITFDNK